MASTILSALSGETVLHRNSLGTVTDNWIIVREAGSHAQSLISIANVSCVTTSTTVHLAYQACASGCLLMAAAAQCSKQACGVSLPFGLLGLALWIAAQFRRQASISFVVDPDVIQTAFGTLCQAATLFAAVRLAQEGRRLGSRPAQSEFLWLRSYLALLL
jgi:hypothetical protein